MQACKYAHTVIRPYIHVHSMYKYIQAHIHTRKEHVRSGNLVVPFARSAAMQTRSFSVVGPQTWNGLPVDLRHLPNGACSHFHQLLKTVLSAWPGSGAPLSRYLEGALYNKF